MRGGITGISGLYTDDVLRILSVIIGALIIAFALTYIASSSEMSVYIAGFVLLMSVIGPWAVVSSVYFGNKRIEGPMPRMQIVLLISVLAGFYGFLIGTTLWTEIVPALPATDTGRSIAGLGTGVPLAGAIYLWAYRRHESSRSRI